MTKLPNTTVYVNNKAYATVGQTIKYESLSISTTQLSVEMYRLYNPNSGEHFYTASVGERDSLVSIGWKYEGVGWIAPAISNTPVYRLYNPNSGDHHYTMNKGERDSLISIGWNDEGIGWYSDDLRRVPLYRQYNPNAVAGSHNYTTNKAENDFLVSVGWNEEGIGWYGLAQQPSSTAQQDSTEKVWHEPVYEDVWVVDFEEWEEPVYNSGCICPSCGYVGDTYDIMYEHLDNASKKRFQIERDYGYNFATNADNLTPMNDMIEPEYQGVYCRVNFVQAYGHIVGYDENGTPIEEYYERCLGCGQKIVDIDEDFATGNWDNVSPEMRNFYYSKIEEHEKIGEEKEQQIADARGISVDELYLDSLLKSEFQGAFCGNFISPYYYLTGYIHHDEEGHWEKKLVQEGYWE
ncbi:MAG: hypothetical protein J6P57_06825 [Lachnospiraceae bacterium]|nr:hypothetical protein [Lachnospiraceae bacterium]